MDRMKMMAPYMAEAFKHDMKLAKEAGMDVEPLENEFDNMVKKLESGNVSAEDMIHVEKIVASHHDRNPNLGIELGVITQVLEITNEFRGKTTIEDYIDCLKEIVSPEVVIILHTSLDIFKKDYPGPINVGMLQGLGISVQNIAAFLTIAYLKGEVRKEEFKNGSAAFYTN